MSGPFFRQGLIGYIVTGGVVLAIAIFAISFTAGCHAYACIGMSLGRNRLPTPTAIPKSGGLEAAT